MILKKLILIICVSFITGSIYAQKNSTIGWGIKGGMNFSGVQTDNILLIQNDGRLGWQVGVFSKSLVQEWGYIAEAQINTIGSLQKVGDETQRNTVGYLSIPLAFQYRVKGFGFYLGGYAGFRLWAKRKSSIPGAPDLEANIKDNIAFVDYGVLVGVNYTYQRFLFDIRYQQGIPNVNTNAQINAIVHNASGQLSIGYFFD